MQENEIIERIQALCDDRSWSYYRLAKESGITYSTLCTMLHKTNYPSIPTLIKLCQGFGITLAQFFEYESEQILLTSEQKKHLERWEALSSENQAIAEKYIDYLYSTQQTES